MTPIKHLNKHNETGFLNEDELSGNKEERKDGEGDEEIKEAFIDYQDNRRF
jgi:hypothetical protein